MKIILSFLNKKNFLYFILFSLITVIFLNHIHNSIDPYYKTQFKHENKETYFLIEKSEIKNNFSKDLISNYSNELFFDRECKITGDLHDRHKVRWVKALFLKKIFNYAYIINEKLPYYVNILIHSLLIFFSLIVLNKTFKIDKKYNLVFLIYVTVIFQQYLSEYSYSVFELFFFSISLYASKNKNVYLIENDTYDLLSVAHAAVVTSGTATLETALFKVPEVVCYKTSWISYEIGKRLVKLKYISLVNLILDKEVVTELIQGAFNTKQLTKELNSILSGKRREEQFMAYHELETKLGGQGASFKVAELIYDSLK